MNHQEFTELLELYALGTLTQSESKPLEAHLLVCAECRSELTELQRISAMLAYAVTPAAPSTTLRHRMLDASQTQAQVASLERARARKSEAGPQKPARRNQIFTVAAAAVIAVLAFSLALLWGRLETTQTELAAKQNELNKKQMELTQEREKSAWLASPEARNAMLAGTAVSPGARAKLTYDRQTGRMVLTIYDLPPTPTGKAYELWYIADGKPVPGIVFMVDAKGRVELQQEVPVQGRNASMFAVTLEPAAGVPSPTGEKYLLGTS